MSVLVSYGQACTIGFTVDPAAGSEWTCSWNVCVLPLRELLGDPTPV